MVATRSQTTPAPTPDGARSTVDTITNTAPASQQRRLPDFASHPSEEELIASYLRPRAAAKQPVAPSFIHDADVYSASPAVLTNEFAPACAGNGDEAWYFFSAVRAKSPDGQRKARTVDTGEGCWHSEAGARPVVEEPRRRLGHRQSFSFVTNVDGRRVRSGWLMVELGLDGAEDMVLCKIYFSPRANKAGRTAMASSCPSSSAGRKRKATDHNEDDGGGKNTVRQRRCASPAAHGGVAAPNVQAEKGSGQDGGLTGEKPAAGGEEEDNGSFWTWWFKNRDRMLAEIGYVDRPISEIQKGLPAEFLQALADVEKSRAELDKTLEQLDRENPFPPDGDWGYPNPFPGLL
ncbi:hypothetical protein ACP4OV_024788 [Aristida adscensionis]